MPSYYLRYYHQHDRVLAEQRVDEPRAAAVAAIEAQLLATYADPSLATKPEALSRRGGAFYSEAAVDLLTSLLGSGPLGSGNAGRAGVPQVVDVRNAGTIPWLDDDAEVEVPALVSAAGAAPVDVAPLDPVLRGSVRSGCSPSQGCTASPRSPT